MRGLSGRDLKEGGFRFAVVLVVAITAACVFAIPIAGGVLMLLGVPFFEYNPQDAWRLIALGGTLEIFSVLVPLYLLSFKRVGNSRQV